MLNLIAKNKMKIETTNIHIFTTLNILIDKYNYKFIDISLLVKDDINDYLLKTYGKLPQNILVFRGQSLIPSFKTDNKIKISFLIDDIHHAGKIRYARHLTIKRTTNVFATYAYIFRKKYNGNYNLYWFPHSCAFTDIKFNDNVKEKVFITGRLSLTNYPNRLKFVQLIKSKKYCNSIEYFKPNVKYRITTDNVRLIYGKRYIQKLNEFLCCFTCDASKKRPYIVAKHFEILSSGSLLLACNPHTKKEFESLGFKDMVHYISCDSTNMEEKVQFILDKNNRKNIDIIRKNGQEYALKKHTVEQRAKFINDVFNGASIEDKDKIEF